MKVSIITATYNSGKTLQETIDSVVAQDYENIEYIIIDGCSTDDTLKIVDVNKQYITKFISEPDDGIYNAFNKGVKLATGDIIGILNSDDIYDNPKVISTIVEQFKEKNADIVYGDLIYRKKSKDTEKSKVIRYWKSNKFTPKSLKYGWMAPHPTLYCTKDVYKRCGLFDETLKLASDYDFILRLFKQKDLVKIYIPKVLVRMYIGGVSNGSFTNIIKNFKENYISIKRNEVGGVFTLLCKKVRKIRQFRKKVRGK